MTTQDWVLKTENWDRDFITGKQVLRREYRIWGYTARAVKKNPAAIYNSSGESLPGPGAGALGVQEAVKLDSYSVSDNNNGTVTAIGTFSNFGFGTFPADPIQERIGYAEWAGENYSAVMEFPIAKRRDVIHKEQDRSVIVETWEPAIVKVRTGSERVKYRATAQSFGPSERRILRSQHQKLHLINDGGTPKYYLFEVGNYAQQDGGAWFIDYSWTREEGIRRFDIGADDAFDPDDPDSGSIFVPPRVTAIKLKENLPEWGELVDDTGGNAEWVLPPFHVPSIALNSQKDVEDQVRYSRILTYDIDNEGWKNLPGLSG